MVLEQDQEKCFTLTETMEILETPPPSEASVSKYTSGAQAIAILDLLFFTISLLMYVNALVTLEDKTTLEKYHENLVILGGILVLHFIAGFALFYSTAAHPIPKISVRLGCARFWIICSSLLLAFSFVIACVEVRTLYIDVLSFIMVRVIFVMVVFKYKDELETEQLQRNHPNNERAPLLA